MSTKIESMKIKINDSFNNTNNFHVITNIKDISINEYKIYLNGYLGESLEQYSIKFSCMYKVNIDQDIKDIINYCINEIHEIMIYIYKHFFDNSTLL